MATQTATPPIVRDRFLIGGAWVEPTGTATADVIESATEEVMGTVRLGTAQDVDRAVRAAREAFEPWARTAPHERAELLGDVGALLGERAPELATLIAREVGMPIGLAHAGAGRAGDDGLRDDARADRRARVGGADRQLAGRARGGRRRRRDHPVELPAAPALGEGGGCAGRRLHGGRQAQRGHAAQRVRARRDPRAGRRARRACSTSSPAPGRTSASRSSCTPRSTWSRSPARPRSGGASASSPRPPSSACRSSWAASRPTSSSTTPTCRPRSSTAWASAS